MKSNIFKYAFAVICVFAISINPSALGNDVNQPTIVDLKELPSLNVPFDGGQDQVSVALSDGTHKMIHVGLKKISYKGVLVDHVDSQSIPKSVSWEGIELESKDKDASYSWYIGFGLGIPDAGRFKLFVTPDGDTYLTWVEHTNLRIAEISKSMDKSKKLEWISNSRKSVIESNVQYVYVGEIIDPANFVDRYTTAHYYSIYLTSLEKDGKGGFKLQMHGKDPSKVYTMVTDKGSKFGWRLAE